MSTNERIDLDALLAGWPPPPHDDDAWEARARAITDAAVAARGSGKDQDFDALLTPPPLADDVPGGGDVALLAFPERARGSSGDVKMSDQNGESKSGQASEPPRKKQSLKEIAARASQSGRGSMPSAPGTSTPLPPAPTSTPLPRSSLATPVPSVTTPIPSGRPSEAGSDDSGMVDLNVVNATATPQQVAAAAKAKPATSSLFDDEEKKPASLAAPTQRSGAPTAAAPAAAPPKKGGMLAGVAIALIGIAAALAIVVRGNHANAPATEASNEAVPPATAAVVAQAQPTATAAATAAPSAAPTSDAIALNDIPSADPSAAPGAAPPSGAPKPSTGSAATEPEKTAAAAPSAAAAAKPAAGSPGDLASAMAAATGADKDKKAGADDGDKPQPAAAQRSANIPEQPPQGSVSAAIGSVMGSAKACVAGGDDVSHATITFGSSGAVSSVSVTGWAAGKGAASCIKGALKAANVGPFQKPSYTIGITIRP